MDPLGWSPLGPSCVVQGQVGYDISGSETIVSGRVTSLAVDPADSKRIYAGTAAGGVWISEDTGVNWRPHTDQRIGVSVGALAVDTQNRKLYVAPGEANSGGNMLAGFGLLIYDPVAGQWTFRDGTLAPPAAPNTHVLRKVHCGAIAIESRAPKRIYLGKINGLFYSDDDGLTWTLMTVDPAKPNAEVCDIVLNPAATQATSEMFV